MQKIPSLFIRDFNLPCPAIHEITPGCEWVTQGEGIPTRKWDGTCCLIEAGKFYKRYDAKRGKIPPAGFIPAQDPDCSTGHWPGWLPVGDGPEDRWHREAIERSPKLLDGTYELIGPKILGNPESATELSLVPHRRPYSEFFAREYDSICLALYYLDIEGIVWHHPDGRMVKIKKSDFGLARQPVRKLVPDSKL